MSGTFDIYDCIQHCAGEDIIMKTTHGEVWNLVETDSGMGIALYDDVCSIKPMFPRGLEGMAVRDAACAVESWNLREAGMALAAVNASVNTEKRAASFNAASGHYADDINMRGKTVGLIGHFRSTERFRSEAKQLYVIERKPQEGDFPDAACDWLLPKCDIVIITGCSIINKTLPHLLTLCENAYTVLTGPSVPMCRELFDFGIDRIAGSIVSDRDGMREYVRHTVGSPVPYVKQFIISR